jgi:hypothetical protein
MERQRKRYIMWVKRILIRRPKLIISKRPMSCNSSTNFTKKENEESPSIGELFINFFVASENAAFLKYVERYGLQERRGLNIQLSLRDAHHLFRPNLLERKVPRVKLFNFFRSFVTVIVSMEFLKNLTISGIPVIIIFD